MYTSGFVLLYRDEIEDWLWEDPIQFHWWLFLRMKAAPRPRTQTVGRSRKRVEVNYGEYAAHISYLARIWDIDERTVTSFLNLLEVNNLISIRTDKTITIIKILNYERFSPPAGYFAKGVKRANSDTSNLSSDMSDQKQEETVSQIHSGLLSQMVTEMTTPMQSQTSADKIILEEEKIKNNFSSTPSLAENDFFENLKKSENTLERLRATLGENDIASLLDKLQVFKNFIEVQGKIHKDYQDFISHFVNWHTRRGYLKGINAPKSKQDENDETRKINEKGAAARRRGSEGSARSADDYDECFPTFENS